MLMTTGPWVSAHPAAVELRATNAAISQRTPGDVTGASDPDLRQEELMRHTDAMIRPTHIRRWERGHLPHLERLQHSNRDTAATCLRPHESASRRICSMAGLLTVAHVLILECGSGNVSPVSCALQFDECEDWTNGVFTGRSRAVSDSRSP